MRRKKIDSPLTPLPLWRPLIDILYEMEIGEFLEVNEEEDFVRIPGGWIYTRLVTKHSRTNVPAGICSIWIPWEKKFKKMPKDG